MATMFAKRKAKLLILITTQVATALPLWAESNRRRVPDMLRAQLDQDQRCRPTEALNFMLHVRFLRQPVSINDSKGRARVGVERAEIIGRR
jgi:hypothetical protein